MKKVARIVAGLVLTTSFTQVAHACPACFAASGQRTIAAYYASTMLLSLMPFAAIALVVGGAYLMRNRQRTDSRQAIE